MEEKSEKLGVALAGEQESLSVCRWGEGLRVEAVTPASLGAGPALPRDPSFFPEPSREEDLPEPVNSGMKDPLQKVSDLGREEPQSVVHAVACLLLASSH